MQSRGIVALFGFNHSWWVVNVLNVNCRPELCQAMISYGNRLICMLAEEQFAAEDKLNELLQQWILLIQQCARDEQVLELRLAAAHSLHTLGIRILLINHGSFC